MMKWMALICGCAVLSACGGRDEFATFVCPNGPELAVVYEAERATLSLNDGRTIVLPKSGEDLYAKPGIVWQATGFRSGRLTDGQRSYTCDQSSL